MRVKETGNVGKRALLALLLACRSEEENFSFRTHPAGTDNAPVLKIILFNKHLYDVLSEAFRITQYTTQTMCDSQKPANILCMESL